MANVTKQASTRFSIVKRSKGQSAVEKASYISRSVLVSEYDRQTEPLYGTLLNWQRKGRTHSLQECWKRHSPTNGAMNLRRKSLGIMFSGILLTRECVLTGQSMTARTTKDSAISISMFYSQCAPSLKKGNGERNRRSLWLKNWDRKISRKIQFPKVFSNV